MTGRARYVISPPEDNKLELKLLVDLDGVLADFEKLGQRKAERR